MQLMPPSYPYPPQHQKPDSDIIIIQQKPFHYNNIILQLEYIISSDIYIILISINNLLIKIYLYSEYSSIYNLLAINLILFHYKPIYITL